MQSEVRDVEMVVVRVRDENANDYDFNEQFLTTLSLCLRCAFESDTEAQIQED